VFYLELLIFGVCIGVISGMLGIGGGIVMVPGLMLLFSFSQSEAQGTSLAALSPPIFIFAAMVYYQNGHVRIPVALSIAVGLMMGAYAGARLLPYVPVEWLGLVFGGVLLYVGFRFVFGPYLPRHAAALPAGLAAMLVLIGAWLKRGRIRQTLINLPPPDEEIHYDI
jgi:uncharacterized protein